MTAQNKDLQELDDDLYINLVQSVELQQYRVEGQQAIKLILLAGDRLTIESQDPQQACELIVLDDQGNVSPTLLSQQAPVAADLIDKQLAQQSKAAKNLATQFDRWQLSSAHLQQVLFIDGKAPVELQAQQPCTVIIVAAAENMRIDQHHVPAECCITHHFAEAVDSVLPEPLAEVKQDIPIEKATAVAYEVKAGEWIQIIDVAGKQCSDFIAFDKAQWESGVECPLDATATRTLMGQSLPQPGLYSRFYGTDMRAMLEVVQDTVGRHDAFLMACTPKYYEDSGYFGHISCSDNFNQQLQPYGIAPRAGWPAINFFFNTGVEPCGSIYMDEPWSRPGDYVLLRANRDLICVSSACPDDIDPANGWVPTDIHVRLYAAEHQFTRSSAHRITAEESPRMSKTSGFHQRTAALTNKMIEYGGYWVPTEYECWGAIAEYLACRERVAILDLSAIRKIEITGPEATSFLQYVLTQNVRRLAVGEVAHSAICLETGGMIDDGTLFKMGEQAYRWFCGDAYTGVWMAEKAQQSGYQVSIRNATDHINNLAVQGPNSRELLSQIIWTADSQPGLENLKWFHFTIGRLGEPDGIPLMVSRTGYTGELGYEVWCHPDDAKAVWDAVWQAGEPFDIAPLGFDALDILRIEAGLSMAEHEFSHDVTPFEAGTGFSVPLDSKSENFIGRSALEQQSPASRHKLMGLVMEDDEPTAHGDHVYNGRFPVGVVTSATQSPLLGKQIAMIRVAPEFAQVDKELEVGKLDGQQKRLKGQVVKLPFYDPKRARLLG